MSRQATSRQKCTEEPATVIPWVPSMVNSRCRVPKITASVLSGLSRSAFCWNHSDSASEHSVSEDRRTLSLLVASTVYNIKSPAYWWYWVPHDCKLVPLHNTCQSKTGSISQCENLGVGEQKPANRSQPFLDQSSPNLQDMQGSPYRLTSFFPIVDIMFRCRDNVRSKFKVGPKKRYFCPQPEGLNARGSSDQIFPIVVISEYVSKFGWDLFSDLRD